MATVRSGNKSVLMVVDFQVGVAKYCWDVPRIVVNIARAVECARAQGMPVVWVQHESDEMPQGSPQWQVVPELVPAAGEMRIFKRYDSSFEQTRLEAELARLGASHIVLAGAMSSWCIRAASYAALERGYDLTLLKDAHTTSDIDMGEGRVLSAQGVVDDLNVTVKWLEYPGRVTTTATVEDVQFA